MPRDFQINGACLVTVMGGEHCSGSISSGAQLGLSVDQIRVVPRFVHQDIHIDDFGPEIPVDIMWQLADVSIRILLVHYDARVLNVCVSESMCGSFAGVAGRLAGAGGLMGGGLPLFSSGNHFIELTLASPVLNTPWQFPAAYLADRPIEIPLGTGISATLTNWRAIPYVGSMDAATERVSRGAELWRRPTESSVEALLQLSSGQGLQIAPEETVPGSAVGA